MRRYANTLRGLTGALVLAFVTMFYSGCASVSIRAIKDPGFSDPIHKLFIILNHGQVEKVDSSYTPYLMAALKDKFSSIGVEIELRAVNTFSLDERNYDAEIASYKPDGVLTIVANGGVSGPGGMIHIFYDVSLYDLTKNKRIWRAQVDASGGTAVREKKMKIMANDLVRRLSEDKMISSAPRNADEKI